MAAGVVWDFGNVLIDWDPAPAIAAGVGAEEAARFLAEFDFRGWNHGPDAGGDWAGALAELERDHPQWSAHGRAYVDHFAASLLGEVAGTPDLVRELHAAGVPQWGLTNWSAQLYPHAPPRFDVLALLDDIVVSGEVGLAKPDPAIYALLGQRIGRRLPGLVFVDDRADNVTAACAAGLDGIVFTDAPTLRSALRERGLPV